MCHHWSSGRKPDKGVSRSRLEESPERQESSEKLREIAGKGKENSLNRERKQPEQPGENSLNRQRKQPEQLQVTA
jgi:hypothetical protein